ncbi:MAG: 16S rRNA (adenine(1518)-N(6)/adenine(1519)-N(6))-dimethyltransferase RsmA [Weeksellaceae bacterium]|nr:16S rRNA (adenine(1518)-N(6)/adenine(1519)-N(6))-dimethyltransferase RsmA [Weeksellaceae bacterium]
MSVKPKKHLGQHFLRDVQVAQRIAYAVEPEYRNHILEIGPGTGVLTQYLQEIAQKLTLVELDSESVEYLQSQPSTADLPILHTDFLKLDLQNLESEELTIAGNFPYNISSQILFHVLDHISLVPHLVGMFQKEVAERVAAPHGNKTYGILSVLVQAYYHVEYLFTVPPGVFDPPPAVHSGVMKMTRYRTTLPGVESKFFARVVKAGFNQRRKTLRNSLKAILLEKNKTDHAFLSLRAEQLSVEDFISLTKWLSDE